MIDTHAHLDFPDYNQDRDDVIARSLSVGVKRMVNIGCDLRSAKASVELAGRCPQIFAAVGIHPHDASQYDDSVEQTLRELANNAKVVAIGEVGLDFYRDRSPRDQQRSAFVRQIALAKELGLPLVVHIRNAYSEALDMLAAEKAYQTNVVLHCFSGNREEAFRAIDYGFFLSVGGVLTFSNSRLPQLMGEVPLESVLLETDAPYLTPHPHRGTRNEPALIQLVYQKLSETLGRPFAEVEAQVDRNAEAFFEFE
jgi:TatD DNase family protein